MLTSPMLDALTHPHLCQTSVVLDQNIVHSTGKGVRLSLTEDVPHS